MKIFMNFIVLIWITSDRIERPGSCTFEWVIATSPMEGVCLIRCEIKDFCVKLALYLVYKYI